MKPVIVNCSRLQLPKLGKELLNFMIGAHGYSLHCMRSIINFTSETWMSVSETPKSRLDTISFPGPAVVKAAGLKQSLWKSQHWQAMFEANYLPCLAPGWPWNRSCCHWEFMFLPTDLQKQHHYTIKLKKPFLVEHFLDLVVICTCW